jgi:hypothetical protein
MTVGLSLGEQMPLSRKDREMMRRLIPLVLTSMAFASSGWSHCIPAPEERTTDWGHQNVVEVFPKPLKKLRGSVILGFNTPEVLATGALVEVFDHPEIAEKGMASRTGQKRLRLRSRKGMAPFSLTFLPVGCFIAFRPACCCELF